MFTDVKINKQLENYIYILLTLMIFLSIFIPNVSIFIMIFAIVVFYFSKSEQIFYFFVFLIPFKLLLNQTVTINIIIVKICAICSLLKIYIVDIIHKKKKLSWKLIISLLIFVIYSFIPGLHTMSMTWTDFLLAQFFLVYFAFEYKSDIDLFKLIKIYATSLTLSGIMWLFRDYSKAISSVLYYVKNFAKCNGCISHPNIFAVYENICIGLLFYGYYKKQIKEYEFIPLVIGCFIFGYLTIARNFIFTFAIELITLYIFLFCRDYSKSFNFIFPFTAIIILLCLIFSEATSLYVERVNDVYELDYFKKSSEISELDWQKIYDGEIKYDPGRIGLWLMYIKYLLTHPIALIFGKGAGYHSLGQTHSHNYILDLIYMNGIVGILLYLVCLYFAFGGKKILKHNKDYLPILIVFIPYFVTECLNTLHSPLWSIFFILIVWNVQKENDNKLNITEINSKVKNNLALLK